MGRVDKDNKTQDSIVIVPTYNRIDIEILGSKVSAHFPIENTDPDIMARIQEILVTSYICGDISARKAE